MRVVGGRAKGRKLKAVPGQTTRPALDRVRTALFDTLGEEIVEKRVLDLFSGTGAIGIEALSRGAKHCVFLDLARRAHKTIVENLETTELSDLAETRHTDAFAYLKNCSKEFDLVYVAPPQYQTLWSQAMYALAERPEIVADTGQVIVQIDPSEYEALGLVAFEEVSQRKYGNTLLVFYKKL